jgi:hypothetical protein
VLQPASIKINSISEDDRWRNHALASAIYKSHIPGEKIMNEAEKEVWDFLHKHLDSIFTRDVETYKATTSDDLSLYEWFVTPHRQDGIDFHVFMVAHDWANASTEFRYDLWEPRVQFYADTAIVSYTFMLTIVKNGVLEHRTHNESRVLIKSNDGWKVVHVHKSPGWSAPITFIENM